jgi:hypothetical protein
MLAFTVACTGWNASLTLRSSLGFLAWAGKLQTACVDPSEWTQTAGELWHLLDYVEGGLESTKIYIFGNLHGKM